MKKEKASFWREKKNGFGTEKERKGTPRKLYFK